MKKRSFFKSLIYKMNTVFALFLLVSLILPYIPPSSFPYVSLLSLTVSPLVFINLLFLIYWVVTLQRNFLLSGVVLMLAYFSFNSFYKFSSDIETTTFDTSLSVLSYNVRLFNAYEKEDNNTQQFISRLISEENPDVICFQEYYRDTKVLVEGYPHRFIHYKNDKMNFGHAIFSKYPMVEKGAFDFPRTLNNTLYATIVKGNDTLRLYNVHLKSMSVQPTVNFLQQEDKTKLFKRMTSAFEKQQQQAEAIIAHKEQSRYPVVVAGDFNNTAFSYVYREMEANMKDAYVIGGKGLGTTFKFDSYPMRIDFIFASEMLAILKFKTIEETFSDHYPLKVVVGWNSK